MPEGNEFALMSSRRSHRRYACAKHILHAEQIWKCSDILHTFAKGRSSDLLSGGQVAIWGWGVMENYAIGLCKQQALEFSVFLIKRSNLMLFLMKLFILVGYYNE